MKHILAVLITAFSFLVIGQATAATFPTSNNSLDSISSPLICDKEEDKRQKEEKR